MCVRVAYDRSVGEGRRSLVHIGAGSAMFCRSLVRALISDGGQWDLRLVDISDEALHVACRVAELTVKASAAPITVSGSTDRRRALSGADAVITTIGVGGRRAWEQDVFIPRGFGIHQPVGDSAGPGGISRALRMIPALVDIARDVRELAPGAVFVNYSNPLAVNGRAIEAGGGMPVLGLCIGVRDTLNDLARLVDLPAHEFEWSATGVNHMTWITDLTHRGTDAWPMVDAALARRPEVRDANPVTWELFDVYRSVAAPFDRHVTEFLGPWMREGAYFGKTLGREAFSFEGTIQWGEGIYREMVEIARGERQVDADAASGESVEAVPILRALWGEGSPGTYSVNLPNEGHIARVPDSAVVEKTVVVDAGGMRPVESVALPIGPSAMVRRHVDAHEITVEAALSGDRRLVVEAMLTEGFLASPAEARALTEAMLRAQQAFLPQF